MNNMGGSCSLQRQRAIWSEQEDERRNHPHSRRHRNSSGSSRRSRSGSGGSSSAMSSSSARSATTPGSLASAASSRDGRRSVRHSVEKELPDGSISALYPPSDNYVLEPNNRRSPKSLTALSVDAVCRSLPYLDGELPPGLPQDVVDSIVRSLVSHAALNATTLSALRHCELGELSLAGCRGVRDEWLKPLSRGCSFRSDATTATHRATTPPSPLSPLPPPPAAAPASPMMLPAAAIPAECYVDAMELQYSMSADSCDKTGSKSGKGPARGGDDGEEASSCGSTATFHSASSTPFVPGTPVPNVTADKHAAAVTTEEADVKMGCSSPVLPSFTDDLLATPTGAKLPPLPLSAPQSCLYPPSPSPSYYNTPSLPFPSVTSQLTLLDLRGSRRLTDRGLLQLTDLSNLTVARLDDCHSLTGRGLVALADSRRLKTLSLANCRRLTDEAVVNVSHLGESLTSLSLDGCRCVTDRSLEAISNLRLLERLDLTQCDLITDDGLGQLEGLNQLEELSLGWCRSVTDAGIDAVTSHAGRIQRLRVLRLARCPLVTDKGAGFVGRLRVLEELDLNGCTGVTSAALGDALERLPELRSLDVSYCPNILRVSWQGKIKSLRTLELCYSGVRDVQLSRLTHLPALEELNLDSCPVGDWALSHLADNEVVPNLSALDLADTDLTDLGMVHLPKFTNMTKLSLFYCNITNSGLRHLSSMTNLEVLNLDSRDISDEGLSHLRSLPKLKSLDVFSGRITDGGCVHLSKITSLESLELCGGGVGDLGCAHLAILEKLTSLNLSQNERITNRGAAALAAGLTNLKALNLSNTRVTSAALRFLGGLVNLQSLALYGCNLNAEDDGSSEGIDALQRDLPSLRCLRLNSASEDDGVVLAGSGSSDEDSDVEAEDEMLLEERHHEGVAAATMRRGSDTSSAASFASSGEEDFDEDEDDADESEGEEEEESSESEGEGGGNAPVFDDDMDGVAYEDANDEDMSLHSDDRDE